MGFNSAFKGLNPKGVLMQGHMSDFVGSFWHVRQQQVADFSQHIQLQ